MCNNLNVYRGNRDPNGNTEESKKWNLYNLSPSKAILKENLCQAAKAKENGAEIHFLAEHWLQRFCRGTVQYIYLKRIHV